MKTKPKQIFKFLLLSLMLLSCLLGGCSTPQHSSIDYSRSIANSKFDQLIDELKGHYESELSSERKQEVKTLQENLLKYLIEASNRDDAYKLKIYQEASDYFNKVYPQVLSNIRKEKAGEKAIYQIIKAPLWTLKDELDFLNAEAKKLPTPAVQLDLIEGMKLFSPIYQGINDDNRAGLSGRYDQMVAKVFGQDFNLQPSFEEIDELLRTEGSEKDKVLRAVGIVEQKLNRYEAKIRNVGSEISKSGQLDLKSTQIRLVVRFMDYYFNHLQTDVIKTIMSELVSAGGKLPEEEVMKIIFKNTGPGLGKVLQQIGKEKGVGKSFSTLMAVLESSGKEVPYHLVKRVVDQDKGGFDIKHIEQSPLGTGTIAQVNRGKIWNANVEKDIALRLRKPGIEQRCLEDIKILRQFIPDNEALFAQEGVEDIKVMSTLIDGVEKFLSEEIDFKVAVQRQQMAYEIYNRSVKVAANPKFEMLEMKVPEVYAPPSGESNLHIQEFASGGVKFSELNSDGFTKKIVAQELIRMWFEEALFKSGFLNADLHQGNFRIVLIEEDKKIKILLYDFGLSSTLSKEDQRAFLLIGAGAHLKSPGTITDGLMVSMNSTDSALRKKLIQDISAEMAKTPNRRPEDWVAWCVQKNYFVSDKLAALARGSLLLKQLPESMGETELFKDTIVKSALKNLTHSLADRNYSYPLKPIDLIKIGSIQLKNSCKALIGSFFGK